jgi:hypothetical protein
LNPFFIHSTHPKASSYHPVIDPVFAPTGEDPESELVIEDDSVMVAVDPLNPSSHIKKTKGEVLKGYHDVFEGRFISRLGMVEEPTMESKISSRL